MDNLLNNSTTKTATTIVNNTIAERSPSVSPSVASPPPEEPQTTLLNIDYNKSHTTAAAAMGGLSIPHHGFSAAFHNYHTNNNMATSKSPFLLPAQLYKSLFASAMLKPPTLPPPPPPLPPSSSSSPTAIRSECGEEGGGATSSDVDDIHKSHFPRNLLYSCSEIKSPMSDYDGGGGMSTDPDKEEALDEKAAAFVWTGSETGVISSTGITSQQTTLSVANNNNNTTNPQSSAPTPDSGSSPTIPSTNPATGIGTTVTSIGGVQTQNPTQGLVHWMSAVMAEHMTSNSHHDPPVGMHYMWNGNVDQCGQHNKEIDYGGWPSSRNHLTVAMKQGYEAKTNEHHHNGLQKGHIIDDGRLDHVGGQTQITSAMYTAAGGLRTNSSNSNSPGSAHTHGQTPASLLVVPQPINATKIASNGTGAGRKYSCKMCPTKKKSNVKRNQVFSSKADLQLHSQMHMRESKPYKCSQCTKAFANSSYLSQHTRIHLGIKPYRCEICQRKFTQLSHLQQHIRTHTGDKPYKCRHGGCQKAFSQLSNLQSHSRCHQTDKPYKCNSCYKCFSDEPALLEHIPKHKESKHLKTHICQYCGKSYTQETYLSKHMQKHSERTDKRPPITGLGLGVNRNLNLATPIPGATGGEHPYWPKVSPDSATSLNDVMAQQHQQQPQQQQQQQAQHQAQQQQHHDFTINQQHPTNNGHVDLQSHHRVILENHRDDTGEDLAVARQNPAAVVTNQAQQNQGNATIAVGGYDASSITKTSTNSSAFTPINSMTPHLNTLGHHQLAQRPYLYDAISFQNKNGGGVNQNTVGNSFPNQLISLHQIRNYAHQPGSLMSGEHLLGVSVGAGKDKG